jgi:hypothetical protein
LMMCPPWWWCLNKYIFMGRISFHWMAKRWFRWRDIFRLFSVLQKNVCLGTSFLLDITVPTAFVLQPYKWSKIFGRQNHLHMYTQWPFAFITQRVNNTECRVVFSVGRMCHSTYF